MGQDTVLTSSMMLLSPAILPSDRKVRAERLREMFLCVGGSNAQSLKDARNSQVTLPSAAQADHSKGFREASVPLPGRAGGGGAQHEMGMFINSRDVYKANTLITTPPREGKGTLTAHPGDPTVPSRQKQQLLLW